MKDDVTQYDFPSRKEQQQRTNQPVAPLQEMAEDIRTSFDTNGFVVLRDYCWDDKDITAKASSVNSNDTITTKAVNTAATLLDEGYSLAQSIFDSIFKDLYHHGHTSFPFHCRSQPLQGEQQQQGPTQYEYAMAGLGVKHGFREIVMRSKGRYEISLLHPLFQGRGQDDAAAAATVVQSKIDVLRDYIMTECPLISSLVPMLLQVAKGETRENNVRNDDDDPYYLSNMSLVVSTPGSPAQAWHADGGHLSLQQHLPCHCLNAFIPLHDITTALGPTELRPGTHVYTRNLAPMLLTARCKRQLQPAVAPLLRRGDVLLFDYRILHRGLANQEQHEHKSNEHEEQSSSHPLSTGSRSDRLHCDSLTTTSSSSHPNNDNNETRLASNRRTAVHDKNRYILVFTIAKKEFRDVLNFPSQSLYDRTRQPTNGNPKKID
jgi:Phytanoyl-CoA dioxygenase (PhyH)